MRAIDYMCVLLSLMMSTSSFADPPLRLEARDFSLEAVPEAEGARYRVEVGQGERVVLRSPEGEHWSIARDWRDGTPAEWAHAMPSKARREGPWLVLEGEVPTPAGVWALRDAYILERGTNGDRVRCVRRWIWTGEAPAAQTTLATRWLAPGSRAAQVMFPGICYSGNPAGVATAHGIVPQFDNAPGARLLCEEHRYPMPFVSLEWPTGDTRVGAALHSLPSRAPHAVTPDMWWSLGLVGVESGIELTQLSGPCALNGQANHVKSHQRKTLPLGDATLTVPPGEVVEKTFWIEVYPVAAEGQGFRRPLGAALDIHHPFSLDGLPTCDEILEGKLRFARSRWHVTDKARGFRMYPHNNEIVMGWCGQAAAGAYSILKLAEQFGDPELVTMGQQALDHLATAPVGKDGFPVRYASNTDRWQSPDPVSQGQAMEAFARAILVGREMDGVDTTEWEKFLRAACDAHADRILADDWRPKSTNEGFLISPLCKGAQLFDSERHRRAALKAADHYIERHLSMSEPYWGGTLDARCEDKEGAWAGFSAFLGAYELTREQKYLDAAAHAMDVTLTYTVVWDIDMPAGRLRDHALKTRGWTVVSAQNMHLDVYGVMYTPELWRMGEYLDDPRLQRLAAVMYRACGQMLDPAGSQGEQLNHTNYVQGLPIDDVRKLRGTYHEHWTVFWMTAHFLHAAAEFERIGVDLDDLD